MSVSVDFHIVGCLTPLHFVTSSLTFARSTLLLMISESQYHFTLSVCTLLYHIFIMLSYLTLFSVTQITLTNVEQRAKDSTPFSTLLNRPINVGGVFFAALPYILQIITDRRPQY